MDGNAFLRRMAAGDPRVWDEMMPWVRKIVFGVCFRLRIAESYREDIAQDVVFRVFERWRDYAGQSQLGTWIYAIARNRCLDHLRAAAQEGGMFVPDAPADEDGPSPSDGIGDPRQSDPLQRLCVEAVLNELDAQGTARTGSMRMIEVLRWWVEHSPTTEELATFLKTTAGAARERKSQILKHLRELCRKHCGDDECALGGHHHANP